MVNDYYPYGKPSGMFILQIHRLAQDTLLNHTPTPGFSNAVQEMETFLNLWREAFHESATNCMFFCACMIFYKAENSSLRNF